MNENGVRREIKIVKKGSTGSEIKPKVTEPSERDLTRNFSGQVRESREQLRNRDQANSEILKSWRRAA